MENIKGALNKMELRFNLCTEDRILLEAWGFDFERNAQEILQDYFHHIADEIRLERRKKGKAAIPTPEEMEED